MRYYKLTLKKADGTPMELNSLRGSALPPGVITSLQTASFGALSASGTNPAALNIEFDMPQYDGNVGGASTANYIRIWGVSLADLAQATNFNGGHLELEAGMAEGYPLASPGERGLLVKGSIIQAFGNWLGTDMTLDFYIVPEGSGTAAAQVNYVMSGKKGEKLSDVIRRTLQTANPDAKIEMNIKLDRVLKSDEAHTASNLTDFAMKMRDLTRTYDDRGIVLDPGITIAPPYNGTIRVVEGDSSQTPTQPAAIPIKFQDMLGQVTWAQPGILTAKMVMRGDLHIGDRVQFPKQLATVTGQAFDAFGGTSRLANSLTFDGVFTVNQIHHWGNYRQADAMSWNTTIWATVAPGALATGGGTTRGTGLVPPAILNQ